MRFCVSEQLDEQAIKEEAEAQQLHRKAEEKEQLSRREEPKAAVVDLHSPALIECTTNAVVAGDL